MKVGVCLSGEIRNFDDPCTLRTVIDNVILPLQGDIIACVSATGSDAEWRWNRVQMLHEMLLSTQRLAHFSVQIADNFTPDCNDAREGRGHSVGWLQAKGFACCAEHALDRGYDWMVRARLDTHLPFVIRTLPSAMAFDAPHGVVIGTDFVMDCAGCRPEGFKPCPLSTRCNCVGDKFALIFGRDAQRAFFKDYHDDFVHCRRKNFTCSGCASYVNGPKSVAVECKLGATLNARGVHVRDLNFAARYDSAATPAILRATPHGCSLPLYAQRRNLAVLAPEAIASLPPGPYDMAGRRAACAPLESRPPGWEHLCQEITVPETVTTATVRNRSTVPRPLHDLLAFQLPDDVQGCNASILAQRPVAMRSSMMPYSLRKMGTLMSARGVTSYTSKWHSSHNHNPGGHGGWQWTEHANTNTGASLNETDVCSARYPTLAAAERACERQPLCAAVVVDFGLRCPSKEAREEALSRLVIATLSPRMGEYHPVGGTTREGQVVHENHNHFDDHKHQHKRSRRGGAGSGDAGSGEEAPAAVVETPQQQPPPSPPHYLPVVELGLGGRGGDRNWVTC